MSEAAKQSFGERHVVVVGAGPGGYAAAFYAADLGFKVTLVDKEKRLGGVCTLKGCIPSKGLLHVAKFLNELRRAGEWGITINEPVIDIKKLIAYKDAYVEKLSGGIRELAKARKVEVVEGSAEFIDAHHLKIGNREIAFDDAVIATGSQPIIPEAFQLDDARVMDSSAALDLAEIPKTMLVIGGGYIGLEMASVYATLGTKITVVEFLPRLLAGVDVDLMRPLEKSLQSRFEAIHLETKVENLKSVDGGIEVTLSGKDVASPQTFDRVLVATGRQPRSGSLALQNTDIKPDAKGFIGHDLQMRTTEPNIYVVGDVAGEPMLAHKAHAEARVAVEAIAGKKTSYDVRAMPAVVFTDPEVAWVGVTELEAKEKGLNVEVARFPWAASGKAWAIGRTEGLSKVLVDKSTQRIVGAGVCGWDAGSLISEYALAIEMGAKAEDVSLTVHPHPTLNETLLGAVDVHLGHATDLYRPRRLEQD